MDEGIPRGASAGPSRRSRSTRARTAPPDRLALWAVFLALFFLVLGAASAHAATGGISTGGGATSSGEDATFGTRVLRVGMSGTDVKILNGIVRSKSYASAVRLTTVFEGSTKGAVRRFQEAAGLADTGVVNETTASALVHSMPHGGATWYGPGFYGSQTACGEVLHPDTIGVANRSLPCGTKVTFAHHGHYVVAPVIDRGPYTRGNMFDLTGATAQSLGFGGSGQIRYAVAHPGSDSRLP